jgi:hypothetical protein
MRGNIGAEIDVIKPALPAQTHAPIAIHFAFGVSGTSATPSFTADCPGSGTLNGNIFVTERCELQAGSTLHGDIEAPRLMVDENVTFRGSAKVGAGKSLPA